MHLMTKEALGALPAETEARRHDCLPHHNLYLNLAPTLDALARDSGLVCLMDE